MGYRLDLLEAANSRGDTVLPAAAKACEAATIDYLLTVGANPAAKNVDGKTPLECAMGDGSKTPLRRLAVEAFLFRRTRPVTVMVTGSEDFGLASGFRWTLSEGLEQILRGAGFTVSDEDPVGIVSVDVTGSPLSGDYSLTGYGPFILHYSGASVSVKVVFTVEGRIAFSHSYDGWVDTPEEIWQGTYHTPDEAPFDEALGKSGFIQCYADFGVYLESKYGLDAHVGYWIAAMPGEGRSLSLQTAFETYGQPFLEQAAAGERSDIFRTILWLRDREGQWDEEQGG